MLLCILCEFIVRIRNVCAHLPLASNVIDGFFFKSVCVYKYISVKVDCFFFSNFVATNYYRNSINISERVHRLSFKTLRLY